MQTRLRNATSAGGSLKRMRHVRTSSAVRAEASCSSATRLPKRSKSGRHSCFQQRTLGYQCAEPHTFPSPSSSTGQMLQADLLHVQQTNASHMQPTRAHQSSVSRCCPAQQGCREWPNTQWKATAGRYKLRPKHMAWTQNTTNTLPRGWQDRPSCPVWPNCRTKFAIERSAKPRPKVLQI